ncbi:hypothetical protein ACO0LG_17590 [Undibacterium sp. Ji42W]
MPATRAALMPENRMTTACRKPAAATILTMDMHRVDAHPPRTFRT